MLATHRLATLAVVLAVCALTAPALAGPTMEKIASLKERTGHHGGGENLMGSHHPRARPETLEPAPARPRAHLFGDGDDWLDVVPKPHGNMRVGQTLSWEAGCFKTNTATVTEVTDKHVVYEVVTADPKTFYCYDLYAFVSSSNWHLDWYALKGKHTLKFDYVSDLERSYVADRGYSVFEVRDGIFGTVKDAYHIYNFFEGVGSEEKNMDFLRKRTNAVFTKRKDNSKPVTLEPEVDIKEGDLIVLNKMVGRWGAFETLEKWVTGSDAGHTAIAMKIDGVFSICESGLEDSQGNEIIGCTEYQQWVDFNFKDEAKPNVVVLPLSPAARERFDRNKAEAVCKKFLGSPYGYHNIIFSWIDTPEGNFPPPVSSKLLAGGMSVLHQMKPDLAQRLWEEALNDRLGTKGLDTEQIFLEVQKRKILFADLMSVPEMDDNDYTDGKSFTCVTFAVAVWKAGGVFGDLNLQATEFTVRDAYQLALFDGAGPVPEQCRADGLPYCQVMGEYLLTLKGYNTIAPYAHMNEHCPSLAPDYARPADC